MKLILKSICSLSFAVGSIATGDCHADNALRALRNTKLGSGPSSFCSNYIGVTTTVSSTVVVTTALTSLTTLPNFRVTDTTTLTIINTATTTSVSTLPNPTETDTVTSSSLTTITAGATLRRRRTSTLYPGEPTQLATYAPSQLSSACSCLLSGVPTTTVTLSVTTSTSTTATLTAQLTATDTFTATSLTTTSVLATELTTAPPASTFTTVTTTVVALTSTSIAAPPPPAQCAGLPSTYTTGGQTFQINCNGFYPIRGGGLVGTRNVPLFSQCVDACPQTPGCVGVDYDVGSGLCDLFNNNHNGIVGGFNSAILITPVP